MIGCQKICLKACKIVFGLQFTKHFSDTILLALGTYMYNNFASTFICKGIMRTLDIWKDFYISNYPFYQIVVITYQQNPW